MDFPNRTHHFCLTYLTSQHSHRKRDSTRLPKFTRKRTDHCIKNRQKAKRERRQENSNHEPLVSAELDKTLMHIDSTGTPTKDTKPGFTLANLILLIMATNMLSITTRSKQQVKVLIFINIFGSKKEDVEVGICNSKTQGVKSNGYQIPGSWNGGYLSWPEIGGCALFGSRSFFLTPRSGWNSFPSLVPWFLVLYFCPVAFLLPSRNLLNLNSLPLPFLSVFPNLFGF